MNSLNKRFAQHIHNKWVQNNHSLEEISCVYALLAYPFPPTPENINSIYVAYIGSTTRLKSRYRAHKVPDKIYKKDSFSILFFIPMDKGFYDYEIKLIKKLQPLYNKQHK